VGDRKGASQACHNLALCFQEMGQYEKAISFFEQMVEIFEVPGDRMKQAKGLGLCFASLGNYAQALKHNTAYWEMAQLSEAKHQAQAALNMGVTLWTQGLAEYHWSVAATDGGLQMQMQRALSNYSASERLGEAGKWLTTALDCNHIERNGDTRCIIQTIELDTSLTMSYLAFLIGKESEALRLLHGHLNFLVNHARDSCAGCSQVRGDDTQMLACGGCRVARSCLHA
jgi:tetratricopeptide (TPR) repeat protein